MVVHKIAGVNLQFEISSIGTVDLRRACRCPYRGEEEGANGGKMLPKVKHLKELHEIA